MNAFEQLRRDDRPEAPSPRFAALLRHRIATELAAPEHLPDINLPERSNLMSTTTSTVSTAASSATSAEAPAAMITPYICVDGAAAALEWYGSVFGAVELVRYDGDDGRIGHAELTIEGAKLMLSDPYPEIDVVAPSGGSSTALNINVADVDTLFERAVAGGAVVQRPPEDQPYGERSCTVVDPFGHRWMIQTTIASPDTAQINAAMEGFTATSSADAPVDEPLDVPADGGADGPVEVGYITIGFDDTARAQAFYGALFGWQTEPGNMGDQYAHIENTALPMGMTPDGSQGAPVLYFRVADAAAYARRVVDLGGSVLTESAYDSGGDVVCRDDQGREFHLWQPAPGY